MATKTNFFIATAAFLAILCSTSCSHDNELESSSTKPFSIEEAKMILGHNLSQRTRTNNETFGYDVGEFVPDWSASIESSGNTLYSIDVPIESELSFIVDYDSVFVRTHSQLVIVKNPTTENTGCYIRTSIPSLEYAKMHTMDDLRNLTNKGIQGDFSGHIIYSTMDGIPYYIAQCVKGEVKLFADISNPDNLDSELSITQYMLRGLKLVRINNETTRSDSIPIEEIVIVYNPETRSTTNIDAALARYLVQYIRALELEGSQNENPGGNLGGGWNPGNNDPNLEALTEQYRNNIIIFGPNIQNQKIVDYLNTLERSVPVYKQLISEFNRLNITITIEFDPDCEYAAVVNGSNNKQIIYSDIDHILILLEELIHVYQHNFFKLFSTIEYEFEAKYIIADYLSSIGYSVENSDSSIYPASLGSYLDDLFWDRFTTYTQNPNNTLRDSIYDMLQNNWGYSGNINYNGTFLPNYNKLKSIIIE